MPVFYPSLVCNFRLRFDEAFNVSTQPDPVSVESLMSKGLTNPPSSVRPLILAQPVVIPNAPGDNLSVVFNRVPTEASIEIPGYRDAGKFSMTFAYRDLPIDPRLVRSCGIEIHMGVVDPGNFATGMTHSEVDGRGQKFRKSILRTIDANGMPNEATLTMIGLVDTWHVKHNSSGSIAMLEGRDLRGMLLDTPANPKLFAKLDLKKPIDDVVRQIVAKLPAGERIMVEVNPDDWKGTDFEVDAISGGGGSAALLPSPASVDGVTRVNQGAAGGNPNLKPAGGTDNLNFWDLITRYCFLVGAIPYFVGGGAGFNQKTGNSGIVGARIRIRPSKSIYDQQKPLYDPRITTPFADGLKRISPGDSPREFAIRRLIYGRDVEEMTFERKYGGVKARVIEVISLDTSSPDRGSQKLLTARWPDKVSSTNHAGKRKHGKPIAPVDKNTTEQPGSGANATSVSPSGGVTSEDVLRISVPGIRNKRQLQEIARSLFEEIGRGEMGGSISTKNLASFLVPSDSTDHLAWNKDPDLTRIRPGDAIEVLVDRRQLNSNSPLVSSYTDTIRRSFDEEVAHVLERLGQGNGTSQQNLATVIVATSRGGIIELTNFYRVGNVKFGWNVTNGINVAFDYQNYVEVRSNVGQSSGANTTNPVGKAVGR